MRILAVSPLHIATFDCHCPPLHRERYTTEPLDRERKKRNGEKRRLGRASDKLPPMPLPPLPLVPSSQFLTITLRRQYTFLSQLPGTSFPFPLWFYLGIIQFYFYFFLTLFIYCSSKRGFLLLLEMFKRLLLYSSVMPFYLILTGTFLYFYLFVFFCRLSLNLWTLKWFVVQTYTLSEWPSCYSKWHKLKLFNF